MITRERAEIPILLIQADLTDLLIYIHGIGRHKLDA
jgi:hypothetical protein